MQALDPECVSALSDLALAVAALITAGTAVLGLRSWRREVHGRARFEAARGLARATYALRNELERVRSPFISATEFPEGYFSRASTATADENAKAYSHLFARRWEPLWQALKDFDAQTLEAEVFWGQQARTASDSLIRAVTQLQAATESFIANEQAGNMDFETDRDFGMRVRQDLFASRGNAENELSKHIAKAVAAIEALLTTHLMRE